MLHRHPALGVAQEQSGVVVRDPDGGQDVGALVWETLTLTQAASHLLARLLALRFVELAIAVLVEPLEHLGAVGSLLGLGGAAQKGSKGKGECESLTLHVGSVRALKGVLFPRSTLEFRN